MLWLLASRDKEGVIDSGPQELSAYIAFHLRRSVSEIEEGLKPLIHSAFFSAEGLEPGPVLAPRKQGATPETEAETKKRAETEAEDSSLRSESSSAKSPRPTRKPPADFVVTEEMRAWVAEKKLIVDIDDATERFRDNTFKNAITDWPGAWRNWMRNSAVGGRFGPPASKARELVQNGDRDAEAHRLLFGRGESTNA
jgi:hypothetical protein